MGIQRARRRKQSDFQRRPGNKPGRRVLVVCEGSETEPGYLHALKRALKLGAMQVMVKGAGCPPSSVVELAIREQKRAEQRGEPFDVIWCVFDRDQHECFFRAIETSRRQGLRVAPSVPSFELWLLLHFKYTTAPFATCDEVRKVLERHIPEYDKSNVDWDGLILHREQAKQHARRVLEQDTSGDEHPNPSTLVHALVDFLERL